MTSLDPLSFRLYPVAPFLSRVLDKDITLDGYNVPAGVSCFLYYIKNNIPSYDENDDQYESKKIG